MECGVDSIVIGDIGLLYAYHEKGYRTPVHASLYFRTVNTNQLLFLKSFGVKKDDSVLSSVLSGDRRCGTIQYHGDRSSGISGLFVL